MTILWHDEVSSGYTDHIPFAWFGREGPLKACIHEVVGPRMGRHEAKCDVRVSKTRVDLDYRPFAEFNEKQGMLLGVLRIEFATDRRDTVSSVLWKGDGNFQSYPVTVGYLSVSSEDFEADISASLKLSPDERKKRLALAPKKPAKVQVVSMSFRRNPDVVAEVLLQAKGICQRCMRPAPFVSASSGEPYLEVHHKTPLALGGEDTVKNAIALCPNCHREAHLGKAQQVLLPDARDVSPLAKASARAGAGEEIR